MVLHFDLYLLMSALNMGRRKEALLVHRLDYLKLMHCVEIMG